MGYRSEVGLAVKGTALSKMIEESGEEQGGLIKKMLDEADEHRKVDGSHLFIWSYIKWYPEGFPEVKAIERGINSIEDSEDYLFIRLGEDSQDTEEQGCWWDNDFNFGFRRELTWD